VESLPIWTGTGAAESKKLTSCLVPGLEESFESSSISFKGARRMAFFTRQTILLTDEITAVSGWLFGGVWWWGSFLGVRIVNCVGEEMPRLWRKALVALVFEGVATEIELTLLAKGSESSSLSPSTLWSQ
jgi:hypothetical protein